MDLAKLDSYITDHFKASSMSNAKWNKLMTSICDSSDNGVFVEYKTVHDDSIHSELFITPDTPYFSEPTLYKEVHWIRIPSTYEDYANHNNKKVGHKTFVQDLKSILNSISNLSTYDVEAEADQVTFYGYRN